MVYYAVKNQQGATEYVMFCFDKGMDFVQDRPNSPAEMRDLLAQAIARGYERYSDDMVREHASKYGMEQAVRSSPPPAPRTLPLPFFLVPVQYCFWVFVIIVVVIACLTPHAVPQSREGWSARGR